MWLLALLFCLLPAVGATAETSSLEDGSGRSKPNQISHATGLNRYPHVYAHVHALATLKHRKILVFGCSTGEEVISLAKTFPHAVIVGVDVDDATLSVARHLSVARGLMDRTFFFNSLKYPLHLLGEYHIIFADSVLCRHPWQGVSAYPFATFDETVTLLVKMLPPGGLLVAVNGNYRVADTSANSKLTPLSMAGVCGASGHPPDANTALEHPREPAARGQTVCCGNFVPLHATNGTRLQLEDQCIYRKNQN
jgi:hypothetical protein